MDTFRKSGELRLPLKTKTTLFSLLFVIVISSNVKGQGIEISPRLGFGTYSMSGLKSLLAQSVSQSTYDMATVDNFPSHLFYGVDITKPVFKKINIGITMGGYSTNGRNFGGDNTWNYHEDINTSAFNLGLVAKWKGTLQKKIFYSFELASGVKFSTILFENEMTIYDSSERSSFMSRSTGWWVEPRGSFGSQLTKILSVYLYVGYELNPESKVHYTTSQADMLTSVNWTGIRAGAGLTLRVGSK